MFVANPREGSGKVQFLTVNEILEIKVAKSIGFCGQLPSNSKSKSLFYIRKALNS